MLPSHRPFGSGPPAVCRSSSCGVLEDGGAGFDSIGYCRKTEPRRPTFERSRCRSPFPVVPTDRVLTSADLGLGLCHPSPLVNPRLPHSPTGPASPLSAPPLHQQIDFRHSHRVHSGTASRAQADSSSNRCHPGSESPRGPMWGFSAASPWQWNRNGSRYRYRRDEAGMRTVVDFGSR